MSGKTISGRFVPMNNMPNAEELLNGTYILEDRVVESTRVEETVPSREGNNQSQQKRPLSPEQQRPSGGQLDLAWGFLFFDMPTIYREGNSIYFDGEVTKESINMLKQMIIVTAADTITSFQRLGMYDTSAMYLNLYINSPGGSMSAGYDLIDFINRFHLPVYTIGNGTVASMGVTLLVTGAKRYITPNTHLLIHPLKAGMGGKLQDMLDFMKYISNVQTQTVKFISSKTKLSEDQVTEMLKNETWLTAEEAVSFGFADEILK